MTKTLGVDLQVLLAVNMHYELTLGMKSVPLPRIKYLFIQMGRGKTFNFVSMKIYTLI